MGQMRVIGLDCATDESNIGVALGAYEPGSFLVSEVAICSPARSAASVVSAWLDGVQDALLAIDAPLGWPATLGRGARPLTQVTASLKVIGQTADASDGLPEGHGPDR